MAKIKLKQVKILNNHSQINNNIKTTVLTEQFDEEILEIDPMSALSFKKWILNRGTIDLNNNTLSTNESTIYVSLELDKDEILLTTRIDGDIDSVRSYLNYIIEVCLTNPTFKKVKDLTPNGFLSPKPFKLTIDEQVRYYSFGEYNTLREAITKLIADDIETNNDIMYPGSRYPFYLEHVYEGIEEKFFLYDLNKIIPKIRHEEELFHLLESDKNRFSAINGLSK